MRRKKKSRAQSEVDGTQDSEEVIRLIYKSEIYQPIKRRIEEENKSCAEKYDENIFNDQEYEDKGLEETIEEKCERNFGLPCNKTELISQ